ncbi:MAG: alanine:cation symporter family protein [Bacilli bacterium]
MLSFINKIVWLIATISIVISSLYFSMKLKFLQLKVKTIFSCSVSKTKTDEIKPFNVLMITLAGRIGVGSIAGIALCIYIGGIGSIFWLWIMTFFSAILAYVETVLGGVYKEKDGKFYKGGPSYYLKMVWGRKN